VRVRYFPCCKVITPVFIYLYASFTDLFSLSPKSSLAGAFAGSTLLTVMTEYDFSPAAYERYIDTHNRVSNWVASQSSHNRRYTNPFVPSAYEPPNPPKDTTKSSTRTSSRSRSSSTTVTNLTPARQPAVRSHNAPNGSGRFETELRPSPSRSQTIHHNHIIAPQPRQSIIPTPSNVIVVPNPSNDHHHRSSRRSSTKSPPSTSHHHHRRPSVSQPYTVAMPAEYDSSGRKYIQIEPDTRNKVVHIPPPRHGEQYVIIPPPGGRVEVVVGNEKFVAQDMRH
jgi:hypothetical protein